MEAGAKARHKIAAAALVHVVLIPRHVCAGHLRGTAARSVVSSKQLTEVSY